MSRIGKKPIPVPKGVDITVAEGNYVTIKGPKGSLEQQLPGEIQIQQDGIELFLLQKGEAQFTGRG